MKNLENFFSLPEIYGDNEKIIAHLTYFISVGLISLSILFAVVIPVLAPDLTWRVTIMALVTIPTGLAAMEQPSFLPSAGIIRIL